MAIYLPTEIVTLALSFTTWMDQISVNHAFKASLTVWNVAILLHAQYVWMDSISLLDVQPV